MSDQLTFSGSGTITLVFRSMAARLFSWEIPRSPTTLPIIRLQTINLAISGGTAAYIDWNGTANGGNPDKIEPHFQRHDGGNPGMEQRRRLRRSGRRIFRCETVVLYPLEVWHSSTQVPAGISVPVQPGIPKRTASVRRDEASGTPH